MCNQKSLGRLFLTIFAVLLVAAGGCGWKSGLTPGAPPPAADGGMDVPVEGGFDTLPDVTDPDVFIPGPVEVDCGEPDQFTAPRRPLALAASVSSELPIANVQWQTTAPATVEDLGANSAEFRSGTVGDFPVTFTATDSRGRSAACAIVVHVVTGPPAAICAEGEQLVRLGDVANIAVRAFDDDGIGSTSFRGTDQPRGSDFSLVQTGEFTAELSSSSAGSYTVLFTVIDIDGVSTTCETVVRFTEPPRVECPRGVVRAPTRRPVRLSAAASDDRRVVSHRWEVRSSPAGSGAAPVPADRPDTMFTPDRIGDYLLVYTATDDDGLASSCEVTVIGTPTPPDAVCPADITTRPLNDVVLVGEGVDDGRIVSYGWRLLASPPGSSAGGPLPANSQRATFRPDLAGVYRIQLTVTDDSGETATCEFAVVARADEGLRVEMFWDTRSDMDLHLINEDARAWFDSEDDCYYANCQGGGLPWGGPAMDDDPSLDIDNTSGFGPENINIEEPSPGVYRVGVHAFGGPLANRVTVRIYCGGSDTEPTSVFGPVVLSGTGDRDFWRVADVTIRGPGLCDITELLDSRGRPDITITSVAMSQR